MSIIWFKHYQKEDITKKNVVPNWGQWAQTTMTSLYSGYTTEYMDNLL